MKEFIELTVLEGLGSPWHEGMADPPKPKAGSRYVTNTQEAEKKKKSGKRLSSLKAHPQ